METILKIDLNKLPVQVPRLKYFLMERGIQQKVLIEQTKLSSATISKLVNEGLASKSNIVLMSKILGVNESTLIPMLLTKKNVYHYYPELANHKDKKQEVKTKEQKKQNKNEVEQNVPDDYDPKNDENMNIAE